jgi:hypothetical protein
MKDTQIAHYGCASKGSGIAVYAGHFPRVGECVALYIYGDNGTQFVRPADPIGRGGTPVEAVRDLWKRLHTEDDGQ